MADEETKKKRLEQVKIFLRSVIISEKEGVAISKLPGRFNMKDTSVLESTSLQVSELTDQK